MNCPSCGAPMHLKPGEDSLQCEYCQSVYFPEKNDDGVRVLGVPSDQACPVCNIPLVESAIAKVRILYCTRCRGMLIPMDVFQALIDELHVEEGGSIVQPAADSRDLRRSLACPRCHHRMETHFYAGPGNAIIASCEPCLLNWLDHGELSRIVHAPDDRNPATTLDISSHE